jgi:hypothetical protein
LCLIHTYVFTLFGKVIEKKTDLEYLSPQKKLKKERRNLIKVQVHTSICLRPKKALIFYDRTEKLFFLAHTFFVLIFQAKGEIMNKKGWHERAKREWGNMRERYERRNMRERIWERKNERENIKKREYKTEREGEYEKGRGKERERGRGRNDEGKRESSRGRGKEEQRIREGQGQGEKRRERGREVER